MGEGTSRLRVGEEERSAPARDVKDSGKKQRTFSLQIVWMTSSGGVPSNSVMMENWFTSASARTIRDQLPVLAPQLLIRRSNELKLTILAREERPSLEHLRKDTASTPDIHCSHVVSDPFPCLQAHRRGRTSHVVLLPGEHDLGCAVVPC